MTQLRPEDTEQARHLGELARHRRARQDTCPFGPDELQLRSAWARGWSALDDALRAWHLGRAA